MTQEVILYGSYPPEVTEELLAHLTSDHDDHHLDGHEPTRGRWRNSWPLVMYRHGDLHGGTDGDLPEPGGNNHHFHIEDHYVQPAPEQPRTVDVIHAIREELSKR